MVFRYLVLFSLMLVLSSYANPAHMILDAVFANLRWRGFSGVNRVCLGDGMSNFTCSDVSANTDASTGVALGNVDGDPFLDIVFTNLGHAGPLSNQVCLGDEMGYFTCSNISTDINISWGVALGDINSDTFLDAVFANADFPGQRNQLCLGDGTGRFTCSDVSDDANETRGVALGNMNSDPFLDVIFANGSSNRVCLGDGTGHFTCGDVSADTDDSRGVALGNIDGDPFLDAVFANGGSNRVCLGDGTGHFVCSDVSADIDNSLGVALGEVGEIKAKPGLISSGTGIPTLSLWAWFLLSILLGGMAMIAYHLRVNRKDMQR